MSPTVNDVSSPRFFTPLPFEGGAAGPSGAAGGARDDPHPHDHAVAQGVKRDASQMMTAEERDERVRRIVSLVKVLLTAKKIKEDSVPAEVVPGVFLGSVGAAHDRGALESVGITHVLTVAGGFPPKFPDVYEYLVIDVADVASEDLDAHFEKCLKFIARALLDGGRVLVHCFAGRSRSSTVVAAYVMATEGLTLADTMKLIKDARPCAQPNAGFARQLRAFERRLSDARSEGRLLGRVQLDAANDGINRLAAVAVDAAAGLESDASSSDEEDEAEEAAKTEPEEKDATGAKERGARASGGGEEGGEPGRLHAGAGATTRAKGS